MLATIHTESHNTHPTKAAFNYPNPVSVLFSFRASARAAAPASPMLLLWRLHTPRTTKMLAQSTYYDNTHHNSNIYLRQCCQRPVGLQGVRKGNSSSSTNVDGTKPTHNKNNTVITNVHHVHHKAVFTNINVDNVLFFFRAPARVAAPASPIWLPSRLHTTTTTTQKMLAPIYIICTTKAAFTYPNLVTVLLVLKASAIAAAPAAPMSLALILHTTRTQTVSDLHNITYTKKQHLLTSNWCPSFSVCIAP